MVRVLDERDVAYSAFNILESEEIREGKEKFADWPTFPQLWVQGELVGGLDVVGHPSPQFTGPIRGSLLLTA
jgi:monothiol glutaredoxin